jgi:hypothetical protein
MSDLRYPIGQFQWEGELTQGRRTQWIGEIAEAPAGFRAAVAGLNTTQVDTPYRPGGWTVRQVVHHVPDSHLNAYTRFKLALTEDQPTIKPYEEARWAELRDTQSVSLEVSLALLDALHHRWVGLLRSLSLADYRRTYKHPEHGRIFSLGEALGIYAWHGRHHTAHITALRAREGW